jgi:GNAT superfamily N-acetyltransferase
MYKNLIFEQVDDKNLESAVAVQNDIFPGEDGRLNFIEAVLFAEGKLKYPGNSGLVYKDYIYWLVKNGSQNIGIVGLYSKDYHKNAYDDAWLAWFGVIKSLRGRGYAREIFKFFEEQARVRGYKNIRLYTDSVENSVAIPFYNKMGMTAEIYKNPNDIFPQKGDILIFSKSIYGDKIELWNNKMLHLKEQYEKEGLFTDE